MLETTDFNSTQISAQTGPSPRHSPSLQPLPQFLAQLHALMIGLHHLISHSALTRVEIMVVILQPRFDLSNRVYIITTRTPDFAVNSCTREKSETIYLSAIQRYLLIGCKFYRFILVRAVCYRLVAQFGSF